MKAESWNRIKTHSLAHVAFEVAYQLEISVPFTWVGFSIGACSPGSVEAVFQGQASWEQEGAGGRCMTSMTSLSGHLESLRTCHWSGYQSRSALVQGGEHRPSSRCRSANATLKEEFVGQEICTCSHL